jgi:hypothetical protein
MGLARVRPTVALPMLCAVVVLVAACGSADGGHAERAATPSAHVRKPVSTNRDGAVILGCGIYCRTANVNDANRDAPGQDVFPPYAAAWVPSRDWAPLSDGTAPITVRCDAGVPCEGALFVTIYRPTEVITAPQRVVGRSDLRLDPHSTRTIGVPLDRAGLRRVGAVLAACRHYRATTGEFPPDPSVGLTIDTRASRDRLAPSHRHYLTWVYFTGIVCA